MKKKLFIATLAFIGLSFAAFAQNNSFDVKSNMQKSFRVKGGIGIQQFFEALWPGTCESYVECPVASSSDEGGDDRYFLDKKNGYAHYFSEGAGSLKIECCYWNRNNGTKLVAFYYDNHDYDYDGRGTFTSFLQFYTYNAKTKKLDPVNTPVTKKLSGKGHLIIELPQKGKNIEYRFGVEQDMGNFSILKWNGYDFK